MTSQRPPSSREELGRVALALLSAAAGAIHFAVTEEHFDEYWLYGVFFLVVAWLQVLWAILIVARPSRALLFAGAAGNLLVVVVWAMTRTIGAPLGPQAGVPEAASVVDVLATLFEVVIAGGCVVLVQARHPSASVRHGAFAAATALMFLAVVPLTSVALVADATGPGHHGAADTGMPHMDDEGTHQDEDEAGDGEGPEDAGFGAKGTRSLALSTGGTAEVLLEPARPGPNRLHVAFLDEDGMEQQISSLTIHAIGEDGSGSNVRTKRFSPGHFVGRVRLDHGDWLFHMIARTADGKRFTVEFEQHVDEPHSD